MRIFTQMLIEIKADLYSSVFVVAINNAVQLHGFFLSSFYLFAEIL